MADEIVVAVTGVSGFLGQRLLPLLDASPTVGRIIGLDIHDPARRARKLDFHRIDVLSTDITVYLRDISAIVHLAAAPGPLRDDALFTRVNAEGTRRMLAAATEAGVKKIVRPSSTAVYGAWANNPVPLTEEAALRPSPAYLPAIVDGECERMLAEWGSARPGRTATRLRIAPIVGPGASSLLSAIACGRTPLRVRGATPPVQVVHVDDAAAALELATSIDLDGAYNVAADGWLAFEDAAALVPRRRVPPLPMQLVSRVLAVSWTTGLGDAPPSVLPYVVHPFVVANDRLKGAGWKPQHSNEEALLLASEAPDGSLVPLLAGAGAVAAGAVLGGWWLTRRSRRRS
ncbi:MAG TPA: NAD-dependent epimerase/dehydratase family protein [Acidimicrobiia bacterium]|nr:NAD-dependent epimerase/dehydratase family protein [Acidimicrobiia bacterium]